MSLDLEIRRNLSSSWYHEIPDIDIGVHLKPMSVSIYIFIYLTCLFVFWFLIPRLCRGLYWELKIVLSKSSLYVPNSCSYARMTWSLSWGLWMRTCQRSLMLVHLQLLCLPLTRPLTLYPTKTPRSLAPLDHPAVSCCCCIWLCLIWLCVFGRALNIDIWFNSLVRFTFYQKKTTENKKQMSCCLTGHTYTKLCS